MRSIYFVNLDKLEQQRILALNEICDMPPFQQRLCGETFTTRSASEYVAKLQNKEDERAEYRKSWRRRPFPRRTYRRHAQQQCALLSKLPAEIVAMCFSAAARLHEMAAFGLTCQMAWDIGRREMTERQRGQHYWAGDRILCLFDVTAIDDPPPGVLNEEELALARQLQAGTWRRSDADLQTLLDSMEGFSLSSYLRHPLVSVGNHGPAEYLSQLVCARGAAYLSYQRSNVANWLKRKSTYDTDYYADQHWYQLTSCEQTYISASDDTVLRNLTTYEYVRIGPFHGLEQAFLGGKPYCLWGVGDLLLLRICWAGSADIPSLRGLNTRGVWAGHRFDIVGEDTLPRGEDDAVLPPWKDVTDEVLAEYQNFVTLNPPKERNPADDWLCDDLLTI